MSIHPDILDLIHAEIDGVASETEQIKLKAAIARDPAVRDEYRRLRGLCDILAGVPREEPPAQIAPGVMRGIRALRRPVVGGFVSRLRDSWPDGRVAVRYAYAVAAGAVIGILGLQLASGDSLFGPSVPEREASATLLPKAADSGLDLTQAGVHGFATLRRSADGAAIGLDLKSTEPVDLVLHFDPSRDGGQVDVSVVRTGTTVAAGSLRLPRKDR
jgi:anti-sigma factor RsiW